MGSGAGGEGAGVHVSGGSGSEGGSPRVGASSQDGGSSSGGGSPLPPMACEFSDEIAFTLPTGYATDQLDDLRDDSGGTCAEGELSFELVDMDGDLRPELTVTDRCDIAGVGTTHWLVYPNEASGFGAPLTWSLPPGFSTDLLDDFAKDTSGPCSLGEISYRTMDMDGDLRPDLVLTDRCDQSGVGTTGWQVFLNEGDGFADAPIAWSLPSGFAPEQLDDVTKDSGGSCLESELSYTTLDMNGDLRPDLVVTDRCDFGEVGTTRWLVFENVGDGFADVAISWSLPARFSTDQLDDPAKDSSGTCFEGALAYATIDMDGDERPELVVFNRCDIGGVGTSHYLVYENEGDGFASQPLEWALPAGYGTDQLDAALADSGGTCLESELSYRVTDANGDRRADLVVADRCDFEGAGTTHWFFYDAGAGDYTVEEGIRLPAFGFDVLDDLSRDSGGLCLESELSFAAVDMDGDRVLDLVVADDCDFGEVGTTHWRVFLGSCDR